MLGSQPSLLDTIDTLSGFFLLLKEMVLLVLSAFTFMFKVGYMGCFVGCV